MKLKVASYNIHKGVTSLSQRPRIHTIKRALRSLDADVIFLQEVQGQHEYLAVRLDSPLLTRPQHELLAGKHYHCAYGKNAVYQHGHHGNALLSAYPILYTHNQDVSDHILESRGILHCVIQAEGTRVHCYVVHFGLFAGGRKRQTEALIEQVRLTAPPHAPLIIAGDFNDWGNRLSERLRAGLGVCEVFDEKFLERGLANKLRKLVGRPPKKNPARTYPASLPLLRLDRMYIRGFEVESARVLQGETWKNLSDHAPIIATLTLKPTYGRRMENRSP